MEMKWQAKCVRENVKKMIDYLCREQTETVFSSNSNEREKKIEKKTNAKTITHN